MKIIKYFIQELKYKRFIREHKRYCQELWERNMAGRTLLSIHHKKGHFWHGKYVPRYVYGTPYSTVEKKSAVQRSIERHEAKL